MIYFLSGASRSGKTIIAKEILSETALSYLSLDWMMMNYSNAYENNDKHHNIWPNEIAEKVWPSLKGMIDGMIFDNEDYVIEGEAMSPELMAELISQYPGQIKVAFIGFTEIDIQKKVALIKATAKDDDDWLVSESDEYIKDHVKNMIRYSKMIKRACKKHQLPYFDTSENFEHTSYEVKQFLLS